MQKRHRVHHRAGVQGGDVDSFGQMRTDRDEHRVKAALVALGREVIDPMIAGQPDAHSRDAVQLDIQHVTGQPVARNAVAHHPAGRRARVADLDLVAEDCQMVGGGQSAGPRADDQDSLAGAGRRWCQHPAPLASKVTEEPLHRMDRHRAVEIGTVADGFTGVVTHPSMDRGKRIVRNKLTPSLLVPAGGGMGKPGLNVLPGRATGITGRQQIDVNGPALAHRPGPGPPMQQVGKGRDILRRSGCGPMERVVAHRAGTGCFSTWRTWRVVLITVSGFRLIESMPSRTKNSAMSG